MRIFEEKQLVKAQPSTHNKKHGRIIIGMLSSLNRIVTGNFSGLEGRLIEFIVRLMLLLPSEDLVRPFPDTTDRSLFEKTLLKFAAYEILPFPEELVKQLVHIAGIEAVKNTIKWLNTKIR